MIQQGEYKVCAPKKHRILRWVLLGGLALILMFGFGWFVFPWFFSLPSDFEQTELERKGGAIVYDRNDRVLAILPAEDHYRYLPLSEAEIPEMLKKAILAAEDKRFYNHHGIDFLGIARSLRDNVSHGEVKSGASTITQQLVKISYPLSERNLKVKISEMILARQVEMRYDKQTILRMYLDRLDFGNLCRGARYAARFYFDRELDQLSLAEYAFLAGLPLNPNYLNPFKHPDRVLKRRNRVLDRMQEFGMIDAESAARAKEEPLFPGYRSNSHEYLIPHLSSKLIRQNRSGMIKTTLDAGIQKKASELIKHHLLPLKDKNVGQAALMVIDNKTGNVLCSIGSAERADVNGGLLDGTQLRRSAGSCLKPFVYALSFQSGATPSTIVPDVPMRILSFYGIKLPTNYNRKFLGPISMRQALASSQNIPAMSILEDNGGAPALLKLLGELGFQGLNKPPEHYGIGLAIGNAEVTLTDVVRAYTCLASYGLLKDLRIEQNQELQFQPKQVIAPEIAYLLTDILSDDTARVSGFGYGPLFRFPYQCAFKTGTSSNYRDNWCIGYTRDYTVGVWVGNFDFSPMKGISGITGAGPIFADCIRYLHQGDQAGVFEKPSAVYSLQVDRRTGHYVKNKNLPIPPEYLQNDLFLLDSTKHEASSRDYDEKGRVLLSPIYNEWYHLKDQDATAQYTLGNQGGYKVVQKIISPLPNAEFLIDPELPGNGLRLPLKAFFPKEIEWSSPTLKIEQSDSGSYAILQEGVHVIELKDKPSGKILFVQIKVKSI